MPTLNIEGVGRIRVDDSFAALSPEEQDRAVDEIAAQARQGVSAPEPVSSDTGRPAEPMTNEAKPSFWGNTLPDMLAQGLTFGLSDEMEAGVKTGGGLWGDYGKELESVRDRMNMGREMYPGGALAAEIAGGVAVPGGAMLKGGTLGARALQGAKVGAGYGAAYGFGTGEGVDDRITGAGVGGALGAAGGALGPVAVEGAAQLGKGAAALGRRATGNIRGALNPGAEAARRVARAVDVDQKLGQAGLSADDMTRAQQAGQPATVMDMGGETTRALARSAANTSPEGRAGLEKVISDRYGHQGERIGGYVRKVVGGTDATTAQEKLQEAARKANRPAYQKAYRAGSGDVTSDTLQELAQAPAVVRAMRAVADGKGRDRAVAEGYRGFNPRVEFTPDGRILFKKAGGLSPYPDLQFWDYTQRELGRMSKSLTEDQDKTVLQSLQRQINAELDNLVPEFRQARAGAASFFGAGDALEAGQKFVTSNKPIAEAKRALDKMSSAERKLFREGFASDLIDKINRAPDSRDVVKMVFGSQQARDKIKIALGTSRARELEAYLQVESVMDRMRSAVQGNSTTARQLAELGLAGGVSAGGYYGVSNDPSAMGLGLAALAGGLAKRGIDRRVAQKVAELLISDSPDALIKASKMVARNGRLLDAMRNLDFPASKAIAQQMTRAGTEGGMDAAAATPIEQVQQAGPQEYNRLQSGGLGLAPIPQGANIATVTPRVRNDQLVIGAAPMPRPDPRRPRPNPLEFLPLPGFQ